MRSVPSQAAASPHAQITDKIVALVEAGTPTFQMPWHVPAGVGRPCNVLTARAYRGLNAVVLWAEAMSCDYAAGVWGTYRQWLEAGAQVRKGEHGTMIVFYQPAGSGNRHKLQEEDEQHQRLVLRRSTVFNQEQVEGWWPPEDVGSSSFVKLDAVELAVSATGARIDHGGHIAAYDRALDRILMPEPEAFIGTPTSFPLESYYSTLLHELVHWTGADHRLGRTFGQFGDPQYATEELVAELGAAFLCADLGISNEPRADHAAYIATWLRALQNDTRLLGRSAAAAEAAVAFVLAE